MIPISYNVRSLLVRKATTFATAFGIALVVFVLASAFMLGLGIQKTMVGAGRIDNAIVIRKGSDTEMASTIEVKALGIIAAAPGVKRSAAGRSLASPEVVIVLAQDKLGVAGQVSNVLLRGVPEVAVEVRPEVHVVDGRPPKAGTNEVMIGKGLVGRFRGMQIGESFDLKKNRPVKVVGVFEAGGSSFESEIWADLDQVRSAFGREGIASSVTVRLDSPEECPKLYLESDAVFLPTLLECFSANYVEAMAMRRPIVTTNLGFARTVCGDAAMYFEPMDSNDAVDKIVELRRDVKLKKKLVEAGRQELKRFGTASERASAYVDICQNLVDGK
jgi:ABC-type lipoprotein release transport system permease subunit